MFKNASGQKVTLVAVDTSTGLLKAGESANITPYVSIDDGTVTAISSPAVSQKDGTNARGSYDCTLTAAETNGDKLHFTGKCSTANVDIVPVTIYTVRKVNGVHAADVLEQILARASERRARLQNGYVDTTTIEWIRGDAYLDADGRSYRLTIEDWTGDDVADFTVKLRLATEAAYLSGSAGVVEFTGSMTQPADDAIAVVEVTAANTAALTLPVYHYQLVLTDGSNVISPARGIVRITDRVIPPS